MKKTFKAVIIFSLMAVILSGCSSILKLTYKNEDFEWVNKDNIAKIIIQSTRDKGFRFVVTDAGTIRELYDSLSSAMPVEGKNPLEPDYIFEFNTYKSEIIKYYYTAGVTTEETLGNLYNDSKAYIVMNRIDNNIIKNLFALRKPMDFKVGYYGALQESVKAIRADYPEGTIGVMLGDDKEMLKYQLSFEIADFSTQLEKLNARIVTKTTDADIIAVPVTRGYKTNLYKAVVEVKNNLMKKNKNYYIISHYMDEKWTPVISGTRPDGF